jgi:hypothetical protein
MENVCHVEVMITVVILVLLLLSGPLAYVCGVDSRTGDVRGGWPGERRR